MLWHTSVGARGLARQSQPIQPCLLMHPAGYCQSSLFGQLPTVSLTSVAPCQSSCPPSWWVSPLCSHLRLLKGSFLSPLEKQIHVPRMPQPSGSFCSATCLMAPFNFYWLVPAPSVALTSCFQAFSAKIKKKTWKFPCSVLVLRIWNLKRCRKS